MFVEQNSMDPMALIKLSEMHREDWNHKDKT